MTFNEKVKLFCFCFLVLIALGFSYLFASLGYEHFGMKGSIFYSVLVYSGFTKIAFDEALKEE